MNCIFLYTQLSSNYAHSIDLRKDEKRKKEKERQWKKEEREERKRSEIWRYKRVNKISQWARSSGTASFPVVLFLSKKRNNNFNIFQNGIVPLFYRILKKGDEICNNKSRTLNKLQITDTRLFIESCFVSFK